MMPQSAERRDEQDLGPGPTAGITGQIRSIGDALAAPIAQIDESFVQVGNNLVECSSRLSKVTAAFEALPADLEGAELISATSKLEEVIAHANEIADGFASEQADLDALVKKVDAARAPMDSLRKVIQMIGILSINARVVAAGMAGDGDIGVFTDDISDLSKTATTTIARFFKAYEQLSTVVHQAAAERDRFQNAQRDTLKKAAERLSGNLEQIVDKREQSAANSAETTRVTRDIGGQIGTTVMAMQVGDATRQRIEHLVAAFRDIAALVAGEAPAGLEAPDAVDATTISSLLHVLDTLLAAAIAEYDDGVVAADRSLTNLMTHAGEIMDQSVALYGQKGHRGESALGALDDDMRQVGVTLGSCEAARRKLDAAATSVGEMVAQLLSHVEAVQHIEASMRLVTLNAAIKCAQLGPAGKALDVIAKQLRELTANTVTSAEMAMTVLNEAADRARAVVNTASGEASGRIAELVGDANEALSLFETVDKRLSAALSLLDDQCDTAKILLAKAKQNFAGHAVISEALADAHVELGEMIAALGAPEVTRLASDTFGKAFLGHLRSYCTMESERRIHDDIIGIVKQDTPEDSAETGEDGMDLGLF